MQQTSTPVIYDPNLWIRIAILRNYDQQQNRTPVITLGLSDQVVQLSPLLVPDPYSSVANFIQFIGGASYKQGASLLSKIRIAANSADDRAIDIQLSSKSAVSVSIQGESGWNLATPPIVNPTESMMVGINIIDIPAGLGYHGSFENNATLFPDGTMICTKSIPVYAEVSTPWGSVYENASSISLGNWFVPFCAQPSVSYNYVSTYGNAFIETNNAPTDRSAGDIYLVRPNTLAVTGTVQVTAVGRWYTMRNLNTD